MGAATSSPISDYHSQRVFLVYGLLTGVITAFVSLQLLLAGTELDFQAYYIAAKTFASGDYFMGWGITRGTFLSEKAYVYPPITVLVFLVYLIAPTWSIAYVVHAVALLATFVVLGVISVRVIEAQKPGMRSWDKRLVVAFFVLSGPSILGYFRGNIDPMIMLLIVVGYLAIESRREALGGALWALAAIFKLFPALLGIWLLHRRAYRAIALAIIVGGGLLVASFAMFGLEMHLDYLGFLFDERSREGEFQGGLDPTHREFTLRRPFSRILSLSGNQLLILTTALVAPVILYCYHRAETDLDRLVAFEATMVALLITIVPSTAGYVVYLFFPLVPIIYLCRDRVANWFFLGGFAFSITLIYPQDVQLALGAVSPLPGVTDVVTQGMVILFSVTSFQLLGCLLILVGSLVYLSRNDPTEQSTVTALPNL